MTPLSPEDCVPPELPENTAGIINLLIDAMKLGAYEFRARNWQVEHAIAPPPFDRAALHEIDQLCHRLGVASGTPSWYWLEFVMERVVRPTLSCDVAGCTEPAYQGGPGCVHHAF
jgi:hypothetical protein